jgi:hypothetical protein
MRISYLRWREERTRSAMVKKSLWLDAELLARIEAHRRRCEHIPSLSKAVSGLIEKGLLIEELPVLITLAFQYWRPPMCAKTG